MGVIGPTLPIGWYISRFDEKSRKSKINKQGIALEDIACGEAVYEEKRMKGFKALISETGCEDLVPAAQQMVKLNNVLPNLNFPPHVTACLMQLTKCPPKELEVLSSLFRKLTMSQDKKEVLPAFVLAQAFKKIFPTPSHAHLSPNLLSSMILILIRGGLPHTAGCKAEVSLFEVGSILKRAKKPGQHNTEPECIREAGNVENVFVCYRTTAAVKKGERLVLPDSETLFEDIFEAISHDSDPSCACTYSPPSNLNETGKAEPLGLPLEPAAKLNPIDLPGRGGNGRIAFTIDDVFTKKECEAMSEMAFGSWDSTLPYKQMLKTGTADHYRLLKSGSDIHDVIWNRIQKHCPHEWNGWKVGGLNDRARFIQYDKGDRFLAHTDGEYSINEGSRKGWRSFITVQVYLTEGMEGGSTRFVNGDIPICDSKPKIGKVLVFEHCMRHTGEEVTNDTRKQIIRTEVLYRPPATGLNRGVQASLSKQFVEGADGLNLPFEQHLPGTSA